MSLRRRSHAIPAAFAFALAGRGKEAPPAADRSQPVRVVKAMPARSPATLVAAGQVRAHDELPLAFSAPGYRYLIAVFGILAVLALEFGDFRSTIVVAGFIPLGIIGGMLALYVSGHSLSFMAVIGFIALIGIEIKNSILLTSLTAIGGLLPWRCRAVRSIRPSRG